MIYEGALNIPQRALWNFLEKNWKKPTTDVGTIPKEQYYFHDDYPNAVVYYQTIMGTYHHRLVISKSNTGHSLSFSTEMTPKELISIVKNIH